MAFRAIAGPGNPILVESPTYPGAIAAAQAAGLRPTPYPWNADGVRPDLLAEAFAMTGARLLYSQPNCHNPTGAVLAPERRKQVVDVARAAGAFMIEDDFARYLGHGGPVPRPLVADDRDGTVVYLTSLTKARGTQPAHRGAGGPRTSNGAHAGGSTGRRLLHLPPVAGGGAGTGQLSRVGAACSRAGHRVAERCGSWQPPSRSELPDWTVTQLPTGGLHLWIRLPAGEDDAAVAAAARQHGASPSVPVDATSLPNRRRPSCGWGSSHQRRRRAGGVRVDPTASG